MSSFWQYILILIGGASVAIADVLIKKAAHPHDKLFEAISRPELIPALILYGIQIIIFLYVFIKRWDLGVVGIFQMVSYALIIVISGTLFFNEKMTPSHALGIIAAVSGVILMNH